MVQRVSEGFMNTKQISRFALACLLCVAAVGRVGAESMDELFENLKKYVENEQYTNAMEELQWISERIMLRALSSLANCTLATIVSMGPAEGGQGHVVFKIMVCG